MSDSQTWVEALNINPELLAEWSSQAPAGKPILVFCIEQGLVDYGDYMRWAQSRYELPILQANFFLGSFDPDHLEKAKLTGDWHPWIFPVESWENITYIACVEPPAEPESEDVRYVLADPRAMSEAWGTTSTSIRALKKEDAPPPVPSAAPVPEEMPEGLNAAPKPFVLDLDNATFNIGPVTEVKPMPLVPEAKVDEPEPDLTEKTRLSVIAQFPDDNTESSKIAVVPPATLKVVPPPAPIHEVAQTVAVKKPGAAPAKSAVTSADEDGAVKSLFAQLRERYSASLILKCSDQNARLYMWDQTITPTGDTSKTTVNLSYPTFIRIVAKTNLPYHGYLVNSPAHHEFFSGLGVDTLPTCVTAIPVRFENHLWGMVVALGSEENQKMESLNFVQEATERLIQTVGGTWSKAS